MLRALLVLSALGLGVGCTQRPSLGDYDSGVVIPDAYANDDALPRDRGVADSGFDAGTRTTTYTWFRDIQPVVYAACLNCHQSPPRFGAPMALFCSVDRRMGPPQWSDLGMFLQSVMLLLREEGLDSCAQECWSVYPRTIGEFIGIPPERMLFTGMAIGHANPDHAVNQLRTDRAPLEAFARFHGV